MSPGNQTINETTTNDGDDYGKEVNWIICKLLKGTYLEDQKRPALKAIIQLEEQQLELENVGISDFWIILEEKYVIIVYVYSCIMWGD